MSVKLFYFIGFSLFFTGCFEDQVKLVPYQYEEKNRNSGSIKLSNCPEYNYQEISTVKTQKFNTEVDDRTLELPKDINVGKKFVIGVCLRKDDNGKDVIDFKAEETIYDKSFKIEE